MTACLPDRRRFRFAGVLLLVFVVLASGCGRPTDEAWLRFLGFRASGETSPLSVLNGDLKDGTDLTVDAEFQNAGLFIGQKAGVGILVNRARIVYRIPGFSPPGGDYPLNLYLSPSVDGSPTTGTLTEFPLVPASLKRWLIDAGASESVVELTAGVTFYGVTDDGTNVETTGSIGISLNNTDSGGATPGTKPTVFVFKTADASKSGDPGEFIVNRSGSVASGLTVHFTTTGSSAVSGVDYNSIGISVSIAAGEFSKIMYVYPVLPDATVGRTLKINISDHASYIAGAPRSATVTIID